MIVQHQLFILASSLETLTFLYIHVHHKYERELAHNLHSPVHSFRTQNTILTPGGIFQALTD